ncbi:septal ring lytic transglycosylase RlpA family protein [Chitinophaga sp.]|uniref:septal ring lytic transglycosylase RlpA family protein n=1 Tax=Chitinophaga sp. TaxID=1869181 RepID=UPI0031D379EF
MTLRNMFRYVLLAATLFCASSCARKVTEAGKASYYADKFQGRKTANGETFRQRKMTAAHRTLPFGTKVKVTNLDNGRTTKVRINDRGPFVAGRIIDLSRKAASRLNMTRAGVANVKITYKKAKRKK